MKRLQFITRLMGLTGSSLFIPKLFSFLTHRKTFTLYEGWIAGYIYYDGPDIEESLRAGQPLELRREPGNEHDKKAIEIYTGSYKMGYISRVDNSVLARLMDQDVAIEAEVAEVALGAPQWERVKIRIQTLQGFGTLGGLSNIKFHAPTLLHFYFRETYEKAKHSFLPSIQKRGRVA